jgi:hypothetical protein
VSRTTSRNRHKGEGKMDYLKGWAAEAANALGGEGNGKDRGRPEQDRRTAEKKATSLGPSRTEQDARTAEKKAVSPGPSRTEGR